MIKTIDFDKWIYLEGNAPFGMIDRVVEVKSSQPCALMICRTQNGYYTLFEYGTYFRFQLTGQFFFKIEGPENLHGVVSLSPLDTLYEDPPEDTEVFTNIDRMPDESGTVAEVTRAMRMMEIERRAILSEIRSERASLEAFRVAREEAELPPETVAVETVDPETGEVS